MKKAWEQWSKLFLKSSLTNLLGWMCLHNEVKITLNKDEKLIHSTRSFMSFLTILSSSKRWTQCISFMFSSAMLLKLKQFDQTCSFLIKFSYQIWIGFTNIYFTVSLRYLISFLISSMLTSMLTSMNELMLISERKLFHLTTKW
jgi:hypothetical protein